MDIKKMKGTMEGLSSYARFNNLANVFLAVAVCVLSVNQMGQHEQTRLVPPTLDKAVKVGWNNADEEYLKSFGMYAAMLMGNVTPKNVNFIADSVSAFVDPKIYPDVRKKMFVLANDPVFATNAGSVSWTATDVAYEKASDKVFIIGSMESRSATGQSRPNPQVVEYEIKMRAGRPWITGMDTYPGNTPKTLKWLQGHPAKPAEQTKEALQ
ncbi:TraE/TraK family type IV conjugative transfer system protein [Pseudomonas abietaniphila]|uniref:Conjugal transfer pilus assembly protein TraE n=1 Tax=Pseudomonas abietaniphila TaxID=89065 RepID=A0A1G8QN41_9PSED|nr:TraE/TraK family type IV conjugative transfer system protein [Pseudomonas abietaniphila]SDJ06096.1 conjugal transfer pilus assembly protein TraE [Pseudomonas abietaniphila]